MRAFHNNTDIKNEHLKRVLDHEKLNEIIQGVYWRDGQGCAVGCTIHSDSHIEYEKKLGIPKILAKLEDNIFENLPINLAKKWPRIFLESIKVGVDLSMIAPKLCTIILIDKNFGVINSLKTKQDKKIISEISDAYSNFHLVTIDDWLKLTDSASIAADNALKLDKSDIYEVFAAAYYFCKSAVHQKFALKSKIYSVDYNYHSDESINFYLMGMKFSEYVNNFLKENYLIYRNSTLIKLLKEAV